MFQIQESYKLVPDLLFVTGSIRLGGEKIEVSGNASRDVDAVRGKLSKKADRRIGI